MVSWSMHANQGRITHLALVAWLLAGCAVAARPAQETTAVSAVGPQSGGVTMKLTSPAFTEGAMIPVKYTCDGQDMSPPLAWTDLPAGARSLALIADDPDAPAGLWTHWVIFNLPPDLSGLPEGVPSEKTLKVGGVQGTNTGRRIGYSGPCPPGGTHRYFFKMVALDTMLSLASNATARDVQAAIKGHILAEAQLMGRYKR